MGREFADQAHDRLEDVRGDESLHDDAVALLVSRDGTLLRMHEEAWNGMSQAAAQDRELKIVAIADGARDNGTCLESLTPDIRRVDVWQACPSLKAAADAATGDESARSTMWFDTHKAILTEEPRGR